MVEEISNRLDQAIANIKELDIIADLPTILEDMIYIFVEHNNKYKELPDMDKFMYGDVFFSKIVDYSAEFVKKFMKHFYNIDVNIEETNNYSLVSAAAAYEKESDKILYTSLGIMLGCRRKFEFILTFFHESYHKIQHDALKVNTMEGLLNYPPSMLLELKEILYRDSMPDNTFHKTNYNKLYYETTARMTSINMLKSMFARLVKSYEEYCSKNEKTVEPEVLKNSSILETIALETAMEDEKEQKANGRLDNGIIRELHSRIINSHYVLNGEEVDRLIVLDKYIKAHPEYKERYPVLKILINDQYKLRSYDELKEEKTRLLGKRNVKEYSLVSDMFRTVLLTDPILYLNALIETNNYAEIVALFEKHPTLVKEYLEDITALIVKCKNDQIKEFIKAKCQGSKMDL